MPMFTVNAKGERNRVMTILPPFSTFALRLLPFQRKKFCFRVCLCKSQTLLRLVQRTKKAPTWKETSVWLVVYDISYYFQVTYIS